VTQRQDIQSANPGAIVELYTLDASSLSQGVFHFSPGTNALGTNIVFNGTTYAALPIIGTGWTKSTSGSAPRPTLTLDNTQKLVQAAVIAGGDLVGAKLTRQRVFAKYLDASNYSRWNLLNYSEDLRNSTEAGSSRPWYEYVDPDTVSTQVSTTDPLGSTSLVCKTQLATATTGVAREAGQSFTSTDSTVYTASVYAKAAEVPALSIVVTTKAGTWPYANFNLSTGAITNQSGLVGAGSVSMGNGWWRLWVSCSVATGVTTPNVNFQLKMLANGAYNGAIGDGLYLWGAQVELSSVLTTYQPVLTTTHYPLADTTQVLSNETYIIDRKALHNATVVQWDLVWPIDRPGLFLPRRQVLRYAGFPGVQLNTQ
jgi:phage-related protein